METKSFNRGAVYSVTSGRLFCNIGEVYEILDWLEDWPHYTHQLPNACKRQRPFLKELFPEVANTTLPTKTPQEIVEWFRLLPKVDVPRNITKLEDPITSLLEMMNPHEDS